MSQFYTAEKVINGKKYVCQFNGISAALDAIDNSYVDGSSNISLHKLSKYLFANVVVEPKGLSADSFETMEEFSEVVAFARQVMQGEFRKEQDQDSAKEAGKK